MAGGVVAANMSYWMYVGRGLDSVAPTLRPRLAAALGSLPSLAIPGPEPLSGVWMADSQ